MISWLMRFWVRRRARQTLRQLIESMERERHAARGAVMIETALLLPALCLLLVTSLFFGLAFIDQMRLQHAVNEATKLTYEDEAARLIESVGGTLTCWQVVDVPGEECYDDGLSVPRLQIEAVGRRWTPPLWDPIQVSAGATRILEDGDEGEP